MTITAVIQIGNSDDKLTQVEWAGYCAQMHQEVLLICTHVHFFGGCATHDEWQNVCWVLEIEKDCIGALKRVVSAIRKTWRQNSAAITLGSTKFV